MLAQELIKFIEPQAGNKVQIAYPISFYCVKTSVLQKERVLQIHGASRFIVIGQSKEHPCCFHTYTFAKLFENLAISGFPGGKATPSPGQINERIFDFKCLAGSSMALLTAVVGVFIHFGVQEPQLKAKNQFRPKQRLVQIINDHARSGNERPALLIAASGGGTRAALYTAAVLEGLAERGQIQDVIMGSGVSGGGAALAYFAGNRPALVDAKDNAWGKYFDVFQQPFIQDVIDGALEWRIVSRYRLGRLLSESFKNPEHKR